ncbi:MAG: hypothetical protein F6K17_41675 [Okeania sp. SIO3C4]|nr:hypothetical protein [Okeania sp. SIO3C4]
MVDFLSNFIFGVAYLWDEFSVWRKKKLEVLKMIFTCSKMVHLLIQQRLFFAILRGFVIQQKAEGRRKEVRF